MPDSLNLSLLAFGIFQLHDTRVCIAANNLDHSLFYLGLSFVCYI